MKKEIKTAILLRKRSQLYKLIYLIFREEGSIFLTYPRKKGYQIVSDTDIVSTKKYQEIKLNRKETIFYNPKISFHPGKGIIHINTDSKEIFKTDKTILNLGENGLAFPICQVLIPFNTTFLDKYSHTKKYYKPLHIEISDVDAILSILIWIHSTEYSLCLDDLPHINEIKRVSTSISPVRFVHPFAKDFTCTLFIHDIGIRERTKNLKNSSIITTIPNQDNQYVFEIIPKENTYIYNKTS